MIAVPTANSRPVGLWDIVKVPFPYTDRPVRQHRPALVIAAEQLAEEHGLLWVLMITSAENRGWPTDVPIQNLRLAGLPAPSVIRCAKIATIESRDADRLGSLATAEKRAVMHQLKMLLPARG